MKIAINGFGRIGRNVFKIASKDPAIEIVGINDLTDPKTLAHLLKYDSTYGVYDHDVTYGEDYISVDGKKITIYKERDPKVLPWGKLGVDVVIESTGVFRTAEGPRGGYKDHLKAGAKKVILTVPAKDEIDQTIVCGVNDNEIDLKNTAFSNASCTTNCLAPISKVILDNFGIVRGLMTTVHSYTNDQVMLDQPKADLRRARSGAVSIIPTTTGAAKAIGKVIPSLAGKMNGLAMRVPTPTGSIVDLTFETEKDCTVEELNAAFKKASEEGPMKGILAYTEDPIVSHDIVGNNHSSIVDGLSTMKMGPKFFKVLSWYDNEMGYSTRVVDLARKIGK
ncbi:MAG: type I glyceraldehyde-3-phosphate dehydrogenase [Spirochaetia bacterium]|jgi:glyceraldehyde 3-phosphate dehydrogenase|nr:type I glyceraldehyde-3-phosphate dehydrogenase [Spirochaetia bacterium]